MLLSCYRRNSRTCIIHPAKAGLRLWLCLSRQQQGLRVTLRYQKDDVRRQTKFCRSTNVLVIRWIGVCKAKSDCLLGIEHLKTKPEKSDVYLEHVTNIELRVPFVQRQQCILIPCYRRTTAGSLEQRRSGAEFFLLRCPPLW